MVSVERKTSINQKQKRIALNNLLFAALEAQNIIHNLDDYKILKNKLEQKELNIHFE